jgi:hypothetical protein
VPRGPRSVSSGPRKPKEKHETVRKKTPKPPPPQILYRIQSLTRSGRCKIRELSRKLGPVQPPRPLNAATEKPLPLQMDHASAIYHPTVELKSSSTAAFLCLSIHPWSRAATLAPNHHHREATPPTKGSCVHTTH